MGLRSWLTQVEAPGDWDFLEKAISINPFAFGLAYIIDITEDIAVLPKGIWVAWSGDGNWSLTEYMPAMFVGRTVFLDALLEQVPGFHQGKGPGQFGEYLDAEDVEPLLSRRWKGSVEGAAYKAVSTKEELLDEVKALRRGEIR